MNDPASTLIDKSWITLHSHYEAGQYKKAEEMARGLINDDPTDRNAWKILAAIAAQRGRYTEAVQAWETIVNLSPDDQLARYNLGVALQASARFDEAKSSYVEAIALNPKYEQAHYNLGILLFESRQYFLASNHFEKTDVHNSALFRLKCAFFLDDEKTFYKKFDALVNQGHLNAVLGSLASRSSLKNQTKIANPFCDAPLRYISVDDLTESYDFESIFRRTAIETLADLSTVYRTQRYLSNGRQTAGNIFSLERVKDSGIADIIRLEIDKYRSKFINPKEGFLKYWPDKYEIRGWLVSMKAGGSLTAHMHDSGWVTGCIYINVPSGLQNDSGNLVLCLDHGESASAMGENNKQVINVKTGTLCLFPSSLFHYTVPFTAEEDRIVLAFDAIPQT